MVNFPIVRERVSFVSSVLTPSFFRATFCWSELLLAVSSLLLSCPGLGSSFLISSFLARRTEAAGSPCRGAAPCKPQLPSDVPETQGRAQGTALLKAPRPFPLGSRSAHPLRSCLFKCIQFSSLVAYGVMSLYFFSLYSKALAVVLNW